MKPTQSTPSTYANMLQQCTIKAPKGALGLNLSRAPWDPYPWVSGVQAESNAHRAGICIGDTLLQLNGIDVLGMRITELATRLREHWLTGADHATMMMWRQQPSSPSPTDDPTEAAHAVQHGVNQQSLQKFATCLQHIAQLLECPVCCDVIKPPGWQCCNGHVLCNNCRNRSVKCPVCRVPLGPRGRCLLSDKLFTLLAENFPCDGVKPIKEEERNKQLENSNKCTNEYHNQPKMALAKSSSAGKKSRKASRQPPEDAVILVVSAAGEAAETGAGVGVGAGVVAAGRGTEECVMPKGNEQSAQIRNNVNEAGLQRVEEQLQPELKMKEEREPEQEQEQKEHNNMLVKPKLKLSKKSWQITGRDQDELRCDEVANINNGQQRSPQWQGLGEERQVGLQESQHCSHPQQYQNYHCSTGKSASSSSSRRSSSSSGDEAKVSQSTSANKLSTVKRATAAAGATAAEIALVVATATATPAAVAVAPEAANSAGASSVRPGRGHQ